MPISAYLKKLKDDNGITVSQWSLISGVTASTISRMLSRGTESHNFDNVVPLVSSLNGSLDEMVGIVKPPDCFAEKEQMYIKMLEEKDIIISQKEALILEKENEISQKEKRILEEKKEKHQVAIYAMAVTAFTILMLLLKVFNII